MLSNCSKEKNYFSLLVLLVLFKFSVCGQENNFSDDTIIDTNSVLGAVELYIPTIHSDSESCRNHSLYYLDQLKELKLWATEMFDATTKLPSGLLYGSTYDLGNFDECLEVKVPYRPEEFRGKYCLTRFTISPIEFDDAIRRIDFELDDYKNYFNISVTQKLLAYTNSLSRAKRNDFHFAFCLPSSCSHTDLKNSLESVLESQYLGNFKIKVDIDNQDCQTEEDQYRLNEGDIIFVVFLVFYVLIIVTASIAYKLMKNEVSKDKSKQGILFKILKCMSLAENTKKIMSVKKEHPDGLDYLAGMKVLSMFLIILGHRCMFTFGSPLNNPKFIEQMYFKAEATVLLNGTIIVDTFFIIAGFLATYLLLEKFDKSRSGMKLHFIYLHRFLRILPSYAVVIAFYSTIFSKIGSGPFWQQRVGIEQERCSTNWWANLLFINNYVNIDQICMFQSWFLDCDIHYFLITPFLVWFLQKRVRAGLAIVGALLAGSIFISFAIVYVNNYDAILLLYMRLLRDPVLNDTFKNIYIPSHMRASPYFLGILVGFVKYKMKHSGYKMPKHVVCSGWFMCVFIMLTTVYSGFVFYMPDGIKSTIFTAFYSSMHHFTWSLCIGWMIIAVTAGHGGLVKPLLKWKPFVFLSRITYSAFLCHGAIQIYSVATIRSPIYASIFNTVYSTLGDIFAAYIFGFFLNIFFESPVVQLEKRLLARKVKIIDQGSYNNNQNDEKNNEIAIICHK